MAQDHPANYQRTGAMVIDPASVAYSKNKLQDAAASISGWADSVALRPCATDMDSKFYRCLCGFQILFEDATLQYAVRESHKPVVIDTFDVANARIQKVMSELRLLLNADDKRFLAITESLTSATFSTSWDEQMCFLTLHYSMPVSDADEWYSQAKQIADEVSLSQITGRSKKRVLRFPVTSAATLADILWVSYSGGSWKVDLEGNNGAVDREISMQVQYHKPEGAFNHPNPRAMCSALEWVLGRIQSISMKTTESKPSLIELYSGCGAHTLPLALSGLLQRIVCVEIDERLVNACRENLSLNNVDSSIVEVVSQDAARWAGKCNEAFDIVLVDPPKQGLSRSVCDFILESTVQQFLYISCGRDALVRDLEVMSVAFEVVDCCMLDLFPSTYAVETLVHLKRK